MRQKMYKISIPLMKIILFESNPELSGNTFQVFEEMKRRKVNDIYKIIWLVKDRNNYQNKDNVYYVNYGNNVFEKLFRYFLMWFSEIIVFESWFFFKKWKNQFVINLMHGMPIKSTKGYVEHDTCDYLVSSIEYLNDILSDALDVPIKKIVTLGYPRNDLLFVNDLSLKKLELNSFSKVIFWLPTYRRHKDWNNDHIDGKELNNGIPLLTSKKEYDVLNSKLKNHNICLLIKAHPAQNQIQTNIAYNDYSNIKFITNEELTERNIKLYCLIGESDALITDYSSVYYDYLLVNKPIALVIDDINEYKQFRGFSVPDFYDYVKGEYVFDYEGLLDFVNNIGLCKDIKKQEREKLIDRYYPSIDKHSTTKVTDFIIEKAHIFD